MRYIRKTISYLKRNGIKSTISAVLERTDKKCMDPMQRKANAYKGRTQCADSARMEQEEICFSIVVPAYETKEAYLRQLIDSVLGQTYRNLQLVIADASATDQVETVVKGYQDERILYRRLASNGGISDNTNKALLEAKGDYIGLLDHDDVLEKDALYHIAAMIVQKGCDMVYTDEDKMTSGADAFFEPNYKPDFNLEYLLSNNYICHFTVIRASLIKELGFRAAYDGAQDYDLFLRVVLKIGWQEPQEQEGRTAAPQRLRERIGHVDRILYHWRAHADSTADNPESKRYAYEAGKRAVEDFLRQTGWKARVAHSAHLGFYEVTYLPDIFTAREDVAGVGTYLARRGRVADGPVLDGQKCFTGMRICYSGYLHRAALSFEADALPKERVMWRDGYEQGKKGRILYLPPGQYQRLAQSSRAKEP